MSSVSIQNNIIPLTSFFDFEPPIYHKILLSIFYKQRRIIGKTRLQKLVFLASHSIFTSNPFGFFPARFGPYSIKLVAAMDELLELGYISQNILEYTESENQISEFELTQRGLLYAEELINDIPLEKLSAVEEMIHNHGYKELDTLLRSVYSDFPAYTEKSVIRERVFDRARD